MLAILIKCVGYCAGGEIPFTSTIDTVGKQSKNLQTHYLSNRNVFFLVLVLHYFGMNVLASFQRSQRQACKVFSVDVSACSKHFTLTRSMRQDLLPSPTTNSHLHDVEEVHISTYLVMRVQEAISHLICLSWY